MHASVMTWVSREVAYRNLELADVLEVGSLNVNGTVRHLFEGGYVGVDMRPGPGVDVVANAHDLPDLFTLPLRGFELILCLEMLEHDTEPWTTAKAMYDVAQDGATLLVSARGYDERGCFPLHDYPADLWRFSIHGMVEMLAWAGWLVHEAVPDPEAPGVFAIAHA